MARKYEEIGYDGNRLFYGAAHFVVGAAGVVLVRYKVEGVENIPKTGRAIIAMNHLNWSDTLWGPTAVPNRHVTVAGRRKYMEMPVVGSIFRRWGAVVIDRGKENPGREALLASLETMEEPLLEEKLLMLYASPNTRTPGKKPGEPIGVDRVALSTQSPVIPGVIKGSDRLRDRRVTVKFGPSIGYPESPRERREFRHHLQAVQTELFDSIPHPFEYVAPGESEKSDTE